MKVTAPTQKPMSKQAKKKALAYIKMCEEDKMKKMVFKDFEMQIAAHFNECALDLNYHFSIHTFVGYVIDEVLLTTVMKNIPSWNILARLCCMRSLCHTRRISRYLWGTTTKYHAKVHCQLINDKFIEHRMKNSFKKY